jgi:hypothetical protein
MKNTPLILHIGISIFTVILITTLVTFLPYRFPSPEILSPWIYLIAAVLFAAGLFALRKSWRVAIVVIPLLLLSVFGFLEETSYGVESGTFQPIYSETYNVQVYDVHNLLPILEQIVGKDLQQREWNFSMFDQLLRADGILLIGLILFCSAVQWNYEKGKGIDTSKRVFKVLLLSLLFFTLAAIGWLLSLPADSDNAIFLGVSALRLGIILVLLGAGFVIPVLGILAKGNQTGAIIQKINAWLASKTANFAITAVLLLVLLIGIAFQIWAPLRTYTGEIAIMERITPLVMWGTAAIAVTLLAKAAWNGRLQTFFSRITNGIRALFVNNPVYIYALACILIVVFSQLMDQGRVTLAQYIPFPNPWGEKWNFWLEETFEMTGAFELIVAAVFVMFGKGVNQHPRSS